MLFSIPIMGQTLLWTVLTVAAVIGVRLLIGRKMPSKRTLLFTTAGSFFINLIYTYWFMPAHTGPFLGTWWYLLFAAFAVGIVHVLAMKKADDSRGYSYRRNEEEKPEGVSAGDLSWKPAAWLAALAVSVLFVYPLLQVFAHQWPFGDAKEWAQQANIEVMSKDEKLPQTDNQHIVLVDREMAIYIAQAKLGNGNVGSKYELVKEDFVKQSINGHLYWVGPLEYKSGMAQFFDYFSGSQRFPGFALVDAENPDPNADVELITDLNLKYTPRAFFSHNLLRHLYAAGYTDGSLDNPTIELRDDKHPFITVTYTRPKFVVGGEEMVKVLLVDMVDGSITELDPDKLPTWIDRVISEDLAETYANNWGYYNDPDAGWMTSFFYGGANQMKVYHTYMAYNQVDEPVYIMTMSSNSGNNHSATGVLVYETRTRKGKFYPGLSGINLDLEQTFKSIQENNSGTGNKQPTELVLYNVDGTPTWVAIYTTPQQIGRSFGGLGFLDAHNPQSGAVQFGESKAAVLRKYQAYLGHGNVNGGTVNSTVKVQSVTGVIVKANWVNGRLYVTLANDPKHRFAATQDVTGGSDLVEVVVGETITLEFKDFGAREVEVSKVHYDPNQK